MISEQIKPSLLPAFWMDEWIKESLSETIRRVNDDLANIRQLSISNYLVLNASKTQSIIYSRSDRSPAADPFCLGGSTLTYLDSVRDLGLHADRQLNWVPHVSQVIKRVYCTVSLINRFKRSTSRDLSIYLVRSLFIPIFFYSDIVYFPSLSGVA
jgi:hypothetical protein